MQLPIHDLFHCAATANGNTQIHVYQTLNEQYKAKHNEVKKSMRRDKRVWEDDLAEISRSSNRARKNERAV